MRTHADSRSAPRPIQVSTCWIMTNPGWAPTHVWIISQLLILAHTCQITRSPLIQTNTVCRKLLSSQWAQVLAADTLSSWYLPTHEDTRSVLSTCRHTCWNMLCSWYLPTLWRCRLSIFADTCNHTLRTRHKDIQINAQLLARAKKRNSCSSSWYMPINPDTRSALRVRE